MARWPGRCTRCALDHILFHRPSDAPQRAPQTLDLILTTLPARGLPERIDEYVIFRHQFGRLVCIVSVDALEKLQNGGDRNLHCVLHFEIRPVLDSQMGAPSQGVGAIPRVYKPLYTGLRSPTYRHRHVSGPTLARLHRPCKCSKAIGRYRVLVARQAPTTSR
jgi:hypothetical protein